MPLGTASDLMVGETVIAIGNAYGYEHTVTVGIVSAIKRDVTPEQGHVVQGADPDRRQHQPRQLRRAAAEHQRRAGRRQRRHPGRRPGHRLRHPGGPHDPRRSADMLRTRRRGQRPTTASVCRDRVEQRQPTARSAASSIESTPTARRRRPACKPGDVRSLQVGDVKVACSLDVERGLLDRKAGEPVPSSCAATDQEQRLELVLRRRRPHVRPRPASTWSGEAGVQLARSPPSTVHARQPPAARRPGGRSNVHADGTAAKAGIQRGDILVGLHQWETLTLDNVTTC